MAKHTAGALERQIAADAHEAQQYRARALWQSLIGRRVTVDTLGEGTVINVNEAARTVIVEVGGRGLMTGPLLDRVALAEAALAALATWVARALPNGAQQMMEDVLADIAALDGGSPEMAAMDALGRALRAAREEVSRDA